MSLKLGKHKNWLSLQIIINPCQICYGFTKMTILNAIFFGIYKDTDTFNKNKLCHMNLEGLSSVCAKLEPSSSKDNEILDMSCRNLLPLLFVEGLLTFTGLELPFINLLQ